MSSAGPPTIVTELIIDGLNDDSSASKIRSALNGVADVTSIEINLDAQRVLVTGTATTAALMAAVPSEHRVSVAGKSSTELRNTEAAVAQFAFSAAKGERLRRVAAHESVELHRKLTTTLSLRRLCVLYSCRSRPLCTITRAECAD